MDELVLSPAPGAATVEVADEVIVVDESIGVLHLLNPMGALVWRCFDGVSPLDEICADLADVHGVPVATVESDVSALAQRLLDERVAVAPGYRPPARPEELEEPCDCGHDHGHDALEPYALAPNP